MKKNSKKIIIGVIILVALGIGAYFFLTNEKEELVDNSDKVEWIVPEGLKSKPVEETEEVVEPETVESTEIVESEETENAESSNRTLSVYDAKQFLEGKKTHTVEISTENEVSTEPEIIESVEVAEPVEVISNEVTYSEPSGTGNTSAVNFAGSANLQAVKANADAQIHAECGGGNENTGFILETSHAYVTYHGKQDFVQCSIGVEGDTVKVVINSNLNDIAWECIGATLSEVFPNGYTLASAARRDCENGNGGYGAENEWVVIDGISSTVDVMQPDEVGAAAYGTIIYTFKR